MSLIKFFLNLIPRPYLIRISLYTTPVLSLIYKGNKYTDPIDGKCFRKFLPYGYAKLRKGVLSPSTLSLERHRLLWIFLNKKTNFFKDHIKVLHFAPEQAFYSRWKKQKNLDYTTTDLCSPLADIKADICNLPFEDNCFDVILCNHVLEHIEDDKKAMDELFRVMKKGGWGIFQIPLDRDRKHTLYDNSIVGKKERTKIFGQYDHIRLYGLDFFNKLEDCGFEVEKIECTDVASKEEIDKYRLDEREIIPFVKKK